MLPFVRAHPLLPAGHCGLCECASLGGRIASLGHLLHTMQPALGQGVVSTEIRPTWRLQKPLRGCHSSDERFVSVNTAEPQAEGMILRRRELLIRQRSETANALRAHMAELASFQGRHGKRYEPSGLLRTGEDDRSQPRPALPDPLGPLS